MTFIVKGAAKAIKKVVSGVKKVFKKVTSSKLGKALLIGATIYLGGAALGMWQSPFQSINGVLAGGGGTSSSASIAATGTTPQLAPGAGVLAPGAGGGEVVASTVGQNIAQNAIPTVAGGSGPTMGGASVAAAPGAGVVAPTVDASRRGILNRLLTGAKENLTKAGGWVQEHPYASALMVNAAAGALSPDELDLQEAKWKRQDEEYARMNRNQDVSNIDLGISKPTSNLRRRPLFNV